MDWDAVAKGAHRCVKWVKQEAGLIVAAILVVYLVRTICVMLLQSDQPLVMVLGMAPRPTSVNEDNPPPVQDDQPVQKTFITGTEAVRNFRAHLQCFSDSGKWVYDPTPRHLPWNYIGDTYASTCEGRHLGLDSGNIANEMAEDIALGVAPGNWTVREELKWVWQTNSSCPWQQVNRDDFCHKIGSKGHIMLVGDSLNHEISWALMNALAMSNSSAYEHVNANIRKVPGPYGMCADIFGEGNGINVTFVRNDRLSPIVNDTIDTMGNFYELAWWDIMEELQPKTLILNRGAHYEDDDKYMTALRDIFVLLSQEYPHVHVIYRNTQPGHLDCMNFTSPLSTLQHDLPVQYHWEDFQRQNLLAKKIVEEFHYTYMDVYTMLSLRADGHIHQGDCLHYCLPGPLDLAVEYLYNIFLLVNDPA